MNARVTCSTWTTQREARNRGETCPHTGLILRLCAPTASGAFRRVTLHSITECLAGKLAYGRTTTVFGMSVMQHEVGQTFRAVVPGISAGATPISLRYLHNRWWLWCFLVLQLLVGVSGTSCQRYPSTVMAKFGRASHITLSISKNSEFLLARHSPKHTSAQMGAPKLRSVASNILDGSLPNFHSSQTVRTTPDLSSLCLPMANVAAPCTRVLITRPNNVASIKSLLSVAQRSRTVHTHRNYIS